MIARSAEHRPDLVRLVRGVRGKVRLRAAMEAAGKIGTLTGSLVSAVLGATVLLSALRL